MKTYLLREESFGGTLFSVKTGKRSYVSMDDFQLINKSGIIPSCLAEEMGGTGEVKIIYPQLLPKLGFSSPDTIFFEVTRACNLSCKHCFNNSGIKMEGEFDFSKQATIVNECAKSGVQEIRFTGGEPMTLGCSMYDLIQIASQSNLRVSIGTNGTLINKESARNLSTYGLNMAIVSIDGVEKSHDAIRGQGNFRKSINGILQLREQCIDVRVNIVGMRSNIKDIIRVVDFFHKLGVSVFVRRFIPLGRSANATKDFFLSLDEYAKLKQDMQIYLNDQDVVIRGHYLKEERIETRIKLPFVRRSCSAGQRALVIDPCGNIQLCGFMSQEFTNFYGNIAGESLSMIWHRILADNPTERLAGILESHNSVSSNMKTNCFAIAIACNAK